MKPLVKILTGTAAVTLALAGCASKVTSTDSSAAGGSNSSLSQSASAPDDGQTTAPSTPTAPSSSPATPAPTTPSAPTKPSAGSTDQIKYTSPDGITVSPDGRTLSTSVQWGGCAEQPQLLVTAQDATQVVVEVKTITHFRMGVMCPNIARVGEASTTLGTPLGNRPVIDAVTHSVIRTH